MLTLLFCRARDQCDQNEKSQGLENVWYLNLSLPSLASAARPLSSLMPCWGQRRRRHSAPCPWGQRATSRAAAAGSLEPLQALCRCWLPPRLRCANHMRTNHLLAGEAGRAHSSGMRGVFVYLCSQGTKLSSWGAPAAVEKKEVGQSQMLLLAAESRGAPGLGVFHSQLAPSVRLSLTVDRLRTRREPPPACC